MNAIIDAGVMHTPALGVDGEVVIEGKVASSEELEKLLVSRVIRAPCCITPKN